MLQKCKTLSKTLSRVYIIFQKWAQQVLTELESLVHPVIRSFLVELFLVEQHPKSLGLLKPSLSKNGSISSIFFQLKKYKKHILESYFEVIGFDDSKNSLKMFFR